MTLLAKLLNGLLTGAFNVLFIPFRALPPIWGMLFISLVAGILMLWIFGKVSDQEAIRIVRDRVRGNLIGIRLFQNDTGVLFRIQRRIFVDTLVYMKYSLIPMVIMIVPLILIMIQLNLRFAVRPLQPGETTLIKVKVRDAAAFEREIVLETPEGVTVETPGVHIESEREVAWRIRADKPGRYTATVRVGEESVEKDLIVGEGWASVSPLRTGAGFIDNILWPGESPIARSSAVESIAVNYPELELIFIRWNIHWLIAFFVLSIVFGFAFKGLLGVEI